MFNAIKWAFKLGQQTERHRIAGILYSEQRSIDYFEYGTGDNKDLRTEAVKVADRQIGRIITRITMPQPDESKAYSLLFPKEDK